jgi:hypothetical protein
MEVSNDSESTPMSSSNGVPEGLPSDRPVRKDQAPSDAAASIENGVISDKRESVSQPQDRVQKATPSRGNIAARWSQVASILGVLGFVGFWVNFYYVHFHVTHDLKAKVLTLWREEDVLQCDVAFFNRGDRTEVVTHASLLAAYGDSCCTPIGAVHPFTEDSLQALTRRIHSVEPCALPPNSVKHLRLSENFKLTRLLQNSEHYELSVLVAMHIDALRPDGRIIDSYFPVGQFTLRGRTQEFSVLYAPETVDLLRTEWQGLDRPPCTVFQPQ